MIKDIIDVVITRDSKDGRKTFNIDVGDLTTDQITALLELLNNPKLRTLGPRPEGGHSFEEQYWNGFIIFNDVPRLVEGWLQKKLAEQYRSDEHPLVHFSTVSR